MGQEVKANNLYGMLREELPGVSGSHWLLVSGNSVHIVSYSELNEMVTRDLHNGIDSIPLDHSVIKNLWNVIKQRYE